MKRVRKGGRELVIADSDLAEYLSMGYSAIDDKGNVLSPSKAMTYEQAVKETKALKNALNMANRRNDELAAENSDLRKRLEDAIAQIDELNCTSAVSSSDSVITQTSAGSTRVTEGSTGDGKRKGRKPVEV